MPVPLRSAVLVLLSLLLFPMPTPAVRDSFVSASAVPSRAAVRVGYCVGLKDVAAAKAAGFDYVELGTTEIATLPTPTSTAAAALKQPACRRRRPTCSCPATLKVTGPDDRSRSSRWRYVRKAFGGSRSSARGSSSSAAAARVGCRTGSPKRRRSSSWSSSAAASRREAQRARHHHRHRAAAPAGDQHHQLRGGGARAGQGDR